MEEIRVIPLIIFLLFCGQVARKGIQLKKQGILVSNFKITLKTILSTLFLVVFFTIFLSELLFHSVNLSFAILPDYLQHNIYPSNLLVLLGAIFLVLSLITMHLTLLAFQNSLRFGLHAENLATLVTRGIFNHSRNPFFLSILLLFLGISLVFPTPFFVGIFVLSFLSIHFFILKEERFMQKYYGDKYTEYVKKVRRYF